MWGCSQLCSLLARVLELSISLPAEPELTVAVFDHDLVGSDDLIGETHIDLETDSIATTGRNCGLASQYDGGPTGPSGVILSLTKGFQVHIPPEGL